MPEIGIWAKKPALAAAVPSLQSLTFGNIFVTNKTMISIKEYIDLNDHNSFSRWFNRLSGPAAARVVTAIVRIEQGNFSNTKSVGGGVLECRIDFGPGYRVYFGRDGNSIVILLGGGTKKRQQRDIATAKLLWKEYKKRKNQEG